MLPCYVRTAFVYSLLSVFYATAEFVAPVLDFTPFHVAIQKAFDTSGHIVKPLYGNVSTTTSSTECLMPKKGIMFSYANHYMMELVVLQHKAMEVWDMKECLESRFITLCMDAKCLQLCNENKIKNCALLESPEIPPTDFGHEAYNFITFLKQELMAEALKVAEEVFFFDADVVLFRNPWIETTYGRTETGQHIPGPYDIMWQRDRGRGPGCSGSVNSGQMYIRNSTKSLHYFRNMQEIKPLVMKGGFGLEQDFVANATFTANMTYCALSGTMFTTHCLLVFGNIRYINNQFPLTKVISYHTACVNGMARKKQMLNRMLTGVAAKSPNNKISGFV